MQEWQNYNTLHRDHTVAGSLRVLRGVHSPQLGNERDILVYLPTAYAASDQHYPVVYMHDGQNLFDAYTSFAGEWQVDETLLQLEHEGLAAIVVGLPNTGENRLNEYSPFAQPGLGGGQGDAYLDFIVQTVKPLIDATFRTLPQREHTMLMGSSMGGLISLYGFFRHPDIFGRAGVMSPALWFARKAIFPYVRQQPHRPGKIYLDMGTAEYPMRGWRMFVPRRIANPSCVDSRDMRDLLVRLGYREGDSLRYVEDEGAIHNESAWARRLPDALRFLLGN